MAGRRVYKRDRKGQFARSAGPGAGAGIVVSPEAIRQKMGDLDNQVLAARRAGRASQAGSLARQRDDLRDLLRGTSRGLAARFEPGSSDYIRIAGEAGLLPKGSGAAANKGRKLRK